MMTSRTLSMPVLLAASISSTSRSRPCAISMQASHCPQGSGVGPLTQLSARARIRAVVVLPTPRAPGKDERLRQTPAGKRVAQRPGDGLLADHVVETLGSPLTGDDLIGHWRNLARRTATRMACGTAQGLLSAAAFRP